MHYSAERMNSIPSVTCVGELIVDFISLKKGVGLQNAPSFAKHPGGAAANVAVGLRKLGIPTRFVGTVGDDPFGAYLKDQLKRFGVSVDSIRKDSGHKTRLAFVSLTTSGERDFAFWEQHPADVELRLSDIPIGRIGTSAIVHISSFLLLREPARSAALKLARSLRRQGAVVCFDPNLRLSLWDAAALARRLMLRMIGECTILRLNEEEAKFLTRKRRIPDAIAWLSSKGPDLVVITRGGEGCAFGIGGRVGSAPGFRVHAVDTTGCGDGFLAGLLSGIIRSRTDPGRLSFEALRSVCLYANAAGALTAMKPGVMPALPTATEVAEFLLSRKRAVRW